MHSPYCKQTTGGAWNQANGAVWDGKRGYAAVQTQGVPRARAGEAARDMTHLRSNPKGK